MKSSAWNRLPDPPAVPARAAASAVESLLALCAALGVACCALGLLVGTHGAASVGAAGALGSLVVASAYTRTDGDGRRR
ncbi:hypothetical protein [Halarchaeum nitratireducens]|uniref:Uncharacterized protein n=1 Tax=Halarchaeum nitratireducens TaxID=489913 RepID=A0A830G8E1_9EURY|nr:hypothetical protein [Halarchaeum nitratireducens]GGN10597.1 hypothetical protein GCM10009021_08060 [Halarchaeum nitratireducens]